MTDDSPKENKPSSFFFPKSCNTLLVVIPKHLAGSEPRGYLFREMQTSYNGKWR